MKYRKIMTINWKKKKKTRRTHRIWVYHQKMVFSIYINYLPDYCTILVGSFLSSLGEDRGKIIWLVGLDNTRGTQHPFVLLGIFGHGFCFFSSTIRLITVLPFLHRNTSCQSIEKWWEKHHFCFYITSQLNHTTKQYLVFQGYWFNKTIGYMAEIPQFLGNTDVDGRNLKSLGRTRRILKDDEEVSSCLYSIFCVKHIASLSVRT